jgi:hypothetical protein
MKAIHDVDLVQKYDRKRPANQFRRIVYPTTSSSDMHQFTTILTSNIVYN